jgi:hypothetical protein
MSRSTWLYVSTVNDLRVLRIVATRLRALTGAA